MTTQKTATKAKTTKSAQPVKETDTVIVSSTEVVNHEKDEQNLNNQLSGADVVYLSSRLSHARVYIVDKELGISVRIPSANDGITGKMGVPLKSHDAVLFTMKRQVWETLKAIYGNTATFVNGIVSECAKDAFNSSDKQAELSAIVNGYETATSQAIELAGK